MDRDGVLNNLETLQMINVLLFVAKENRNANMYKDLTKQDALKDIFSFSSIRSEQSQKWVSFIYNIYTSSINSLLILIFIFL